MKKISVTFYYDNDKKSETVEVPIHHTLMEASKYYSENNYIPGIDADCGGSCACATCHVHIDERFYEPIPKETAEIELLEYEPEFKPKQSRLSCQIKLTEKHNGLIATLLKDL